jgi:zinc transporter 1
MNNRLKTLYFVLILNCIIFLAEFIISIRTASVALKADSFHVLSDIVATIITIYSIKLSSKDKTPHATYGWLRSEIIGGLVNSVFLLALAFNIFIEATEKIFDIDEIKDKLDKGIDEVFIVGWVGLIANVLSLAIVHMGHEHHHGTVESYVSVNTDDITSINDTKSKTNKKSINIRALWLHIIGDILGSVVVVISSATIKYATGDFRFYMDPIGSLITVIIICVVTFPLLSKCRRILLHHVPKNIDMLQLEYDLKNIENIVNIHELHVWQLDDEKLVGSLHFNLIQIDDVDNIGNIIKDTVNNIKKVLHDYGIHSTTIQPEFHSTNIKDGIADCLIDNDDGEIKINIHNNCVDVECNNKCSYQKCCPPKNNNILTI